MNILYAEDNKELRETITEILKSSGHDVLAVENGSLLLIALRGQKQFDVVVTDNRMPTMSGLEALRHIRANIRYEGLPVIMLSGNIETQLHAEVVRLGGIFIDKVQDGSRGLQRELEKIRLAKEGS